MKEIIYKQAAIDALNGEIKLKDSDDVDNVARYIQQVARKINELPSAEQWIPCSERYPDMDERVLVYTVAHDYHVWDCMSNRADNYFWEDDEGLYHDKYEADLWMPLPEPYKAESEDKE